MLEAMAPDLNVIGQEPLVNGLRGMCHEHAAFERRLDTL